jgi:hypothetical protein
MNEHPFVVLVSTADELAAGRLSPDRQAAVLESFRTHGAAIIAGAVDLGHCDALRAAMDEDLDDAASRPFALDIPGHVQHNPPPRAKDLYIDIIANPIAVSLARALMGSVRLSLYTGNTMLPHTTQHQPLHWDEYQLWPDLETSPPPAAVTVNIPLVDVTMANGALEAWPGTQHDVRSARFFPKTLEVPDEWIEARRAEVPPVRIPLPKGALLLRDPRMWHRGTTNSTDHARPMVAMSYQPWWYRPLAIDFYRDAEPVLAKAGIKMAARFRDAFDHLVWPPNWDLVPAPVEADERNS